MNESEIKQKLTDEEYHVLRQKGTEAPGSGIYNDHFEKGTYKCKVCDTPLFDSDSKYNSRCGWPAFDKAKNVERHEDLSHSMKRIEVTCKTCGSHLGHVFPDGPKETTGERYCINSICLNFNKE